MNGFSRRQPRVEATEIKTAAAYAKRRMRRGETLKAAAAPAGRDDALPRVRKTVKAPRWRGQPRPSPPSRHPPSGSRMRSAARARGLGGGTIS